MGGGCRFRTGTPGHRGSRAWSPTGWPESTCPGPWPAGGRWSCSAGGRRTVAISASPHELTDEPTRALLLAARLHADPRTLPDALAKLLRADSASWVYGDEAEEPSAATTLVVPVGPRRAVRVDRV